MANTYENQDIPFGDEIPAGPPPEGWEDVAATPIGGAHYENVPAVKVDSNGMVSMDDLAAMMADFKKQIIAPTGRRIKLENKVFKFPEGDEVDNFRCVIVGFVYANSYYDTEYVPGVYNPPKCFSISLTPKGAKPSTQITKPECYECDMCWANQFGSRGRGKACQNRMQIAVLPADADAGTNLHILDLSPTALRPFNNFLATAVRTLGVLPQMMTVLVQADRSVKWDAIQFADPQPIKDGEFVKMVMSRRDEARDLLMTEPNLAELAEAHTSKGNDLGKGGRKARV